MASLTISTSLDSNPGRLRNDSFSSYLTLVRETFQFEHETSGPRRSSSLLTSLSLNRRRSDDGELDIFDAEKYFSGGMDAAVESPPERGVKKPTKREPKRKPPPSRYSSSEASCNSQRTLLRDRRRYPAPESRGRENGKRFLSVFRCPCLGKKAVEVEVGVRPAIRLHELEHGKDLRMERLGFGFKEEGVVAFAPNLNTVAAKVTVGREIKREEEKEVGERRVITLTSVNAAARGRGGDDDDDDLGSESSSDLFEIESLSVSSQALFEQRDGAESAATGGYEPSEASIEWSVATASAVNFSVASESTATGKKASRPGIFTGCASRKAVGVAADAHRVVSARSVSGRTTTTTTCRARSFELMESELGEDGQEVAAAPVVLSRIQARRGIYMH